jgi:hypothetical protein
VFFNRCKQEEWGIRLSLLSWCVSFKAIGLMVDISVQNGVDMYHGKENNHASYKHLQTTILYYIIYEENSRSIIYIWVLQMSSSSSRCSRSSRSRSRSSSSNNNNSSSRSSRRRRSSSSRCR